MPIEVTVQIAEEIQALLPPDPPDWEAIFNQWQAWLGLEYELPYFNAPCELTLRLTDDLEIQYLNHRFRQQNQPTDVLAFASLEVSIPLLPLPCINLGDIVISVTTAQQQAITQNWSLSQELLWLASHGFLHLLGWDHPDEPSLEEMWLIQESLVQMNPKPE